jgi:DNA-binding NarL/FixJ family response regulator
LIRVLLVDDHELLRDGIAALLRDEPDIAVAGAAVDGVEAVSQYRELTPDVVLMDLQMPRMNGIDAIRAIREEFREARIVVLTTYDGDVLALRAIKAGASGYLLKSMLRRQLVETIREVHGGKRRIPAEIAVRIAEHSSDDLLSDRDVLQLVASGRSNRDIAGQLSISEETVKSHMKNILGKLGVNDRTLAVTVAMKRGILTP